MAFQMLSPLSLSPVCGLFNSMSGQAGKQTINCLGSLASRQTGLRD